MPDFVRNDLKLCRTYQQKKPKTNAQKIRAMSDEELAEIIEPRGFDCADYCKDFGNGCGYTCTHNRAKDFILQWLKAEVKE
jgi:hypothetical protein